MKPIKELRSQVFHLNVARDLRHMMSALSVSHSFPHSSVLIGKQSLRNEGVEVTILAIITMMHVQLRRDRITDLF